MPQSNLHRTCNYLTDEITRHRVLIGPRARDKHSSLLIPGNHVALRRICNTVSVGPHKIVLNSPANPHARACIWIVGGRGSVVSVGRCRDGRDEPHLGRVSEHREAPPPLYVGRLWTQPLHKMGPMLLEQLRRQVSDCQITTTNWINPLMLRFKFLRVLWVNS